MCRRSPGRHPRERSNTIPGGVRERPNRHAWKACEGQPSVGSNPTPSAIFPVVRGDLDDARSRAIRPIFRPRSVLTPPLCVTMWCGRWRRGLVLGRPSRAPPLPDRRPPVAGTAHRRPARRDRRVDVRRDRADGTRRGVLRIAALPGRSALAVGDDDRRHHGVDRRRGASRELRDARRPDARTLAGTRHLQPQRLCLDGQRPDDPSSPPIPGSHPRHRRRPRRGHHRLGRGRGLVARHHRSRARNRHRARHRSPARALPGAEFRHGRARPPIRVRRHRATAQPHPPVGVGVLPRHR